MESLRGDNSSNKPKIYYSDHKTKLLAALNSDRSDEDNYCDVTIAANQRQFPAHKCVLGSISNYFHRMFKTEMKESYESIINISIIEDDILEIALDFIYTATIQFTPENIMRILIAADYLQINELKKCCVSYLGESLNPTNCLDIQMSGEMFNCPSLSDTAETLAAQNFDKVIQQAQFKELGKKEAIKFLSSRDQKAFGSKEVYEGVLSWVYHDLENRKKEFTELFKLVKLHLLPLDYLEEKVISQELVKNFKKCQDHLQQEMLYRLKLPTLQSHTDSNVKENGSNQTIASVPDPASEKPPSAAPSKAQNKRTRKKKTKATEPTSPTASKPSVDSNATTSSQTSDLEADVKFSRELAAILRHGKRSDIVHESDGFVPVNKILQNKAVKKLHGNKTFKDLKRIVESDSKKRFELKLFTPVWKIRATYGHTTKSKNKVNDAPSSILSTSSTSSISSYPGDAEVSKELVRILRNGYYKDLKVNSDGYASVKEILQHPRFRKFCGNLSFDDLEYITETSGKNNFLMTAVASGWMIKALHVPTLSVDDIKSNVLSDLSVQFVHHITSHKGWQAIQINGLSKMKRTHIHFHPGTPSKELASNNKKPNMDVAVVVNIPEARKAGLQFLTTNDETILCPGDENGFISTSLFAQVIRLQPFWKKIL